MSLDVGYHRDSLRTGESSPESTSWRLRLGVIDEPVKDSTVISCRLAVGVEDSVEVGRHRRQRLQDTRLSTHGSAPVTHPLLLVLTLEHGENGNPDEEDPRGEQTDDPESGHGTDGSWDADDQHRDPQDETRGGCS